MAQAAKQLKVRKDLAEAAAQELRDKEEEKLKKRNRSRDRRRKVNLPAGGEENRAARKRGETENEREGEGEVRRKKEGVADCCRALPLRSAPLRSPLFSSFSPFSFHVIIQDRCSTACTQAHCVSPPAMQCCLFMEAVCEGALM